jgi:hypothetical protein
MSRLMQQPTCAPLFVRCVLAVQVTSYQGPYLQANEPSKVLRENYGCKCVRSPDLFDQNDLGDQ